jgi:hypothetical protein
MNTAGCVVVAILHSKNQLYIPNHKLLYICDILHGLNIFPIESANEVADNHEFDAAQMHRWLKAR